MPSVKFNFFDHTKLLLADSARLITFIAADSELRAYTLAGVVRDAARYGLLQTSKAGEPTIVAPDENVLVEPRRLARSKRIHGVLQKLTFCIEVLK